MQANPLEPTTKPPRFLKLPQVLERTQLGKTSLYQRMKDGDFPASVRLSENSVAWLESDVDAWVLKMAAQVDKGAASARSSQAPDLPAMKPQASPAAAPGVQAPALFDTHAAQAQRAGECLQHNPEGLTYDELKACARLASPTKVVSYMEREAGFVLAKIRAPRRDEFGVYRKGVTRVKLIRWPTPKAQKELPL
jgi:prophage regulatory protein